MNIRTGTVHKTKGDRTACNQPLPKDRKVVLRTNAANRKLCGRCFDVNEPQRLMRYCARCGHEQQTEHANANFTNWVCDSCKLDHYRKHVVPMRSKSLAIRRRIVNERGNKCEVCGESGKVNMHHIKPLSAGGDNSDGNLILLCKTCHKKAHKNGMNKSFIFWQRP